MAQARGNIEQAVRTAGTVRKRAGGQDPLRAFSVLLMAVFFVVVRALDIIKPPPARQLQAIPGGRGIVVDDFVANLYSLGVNWAVYSYLFR